MWTLKLFSQLPNKFIVSWKPCLNLCSLKRLKPSLGLAIRQIPPGLQQFLREFGDGRTNYRILVLKTEKLSDFLR